MNDLADVVDTARAWVRWSWLAVLAAVVAFFAAGILADQSSVQPTATATLALTDEVEWPFYDAALVRQVGHLDDGEIIGAAASAAGTDASNITIDVEDPGSSNSTLTISVTAESGAQAAEVANAVTEAIIARDIAILTEQRETEVANLSAAATGDDAATFAGDLARAEAVLAENRPEIEVADRADAPSDSTSASSLPIVAALVAGLGALLAAPALERRLGTVQGPNHVELARSNLRWIDTGSNDGLLPIAQAGDAIAAPFVGSSDGLAVASADNPADTAPIANALANRLNRSVVAAGDLSQANATEACVLAQNVALVVRRGVTKRAKLARTLERFESLGVNIEGIIVLPKSGGSAGRAEQAHESVSAG